MPDTKLATSLLDEQFMRAHAWLEATMHGVTNAVAAWQPQGRANPIGAEYLHHITGEDVIINAVLQGTAPLMTSSYQGRTGMSMVPPIGDWSEWAKGVNVEIDTARRYAAAVYAATHAYLKELHDDDLAREIDVSEFGLGKMTLAAFLSILLANCHNHCGEISCLKGLQGLQGYPI